MTDAPDSLITYGMNCLWWDAIDKTGTVTTDLPGHKLPVCPHCGSVLFQIEAKDWFSGLKRYEAEGNPGYEAQWLWARGKCFRTAADQAAAYAVHLKEAAPPAPAKVVAMIPCARTGCPAAATVAFKVLVPAKGFHEDNHTPLTTIMGIKVCQLHFDEDEANLVERNDAMREAIEAGCRMMGRVMPDWSRAWVEPIGILTPEYKQFEAMAGRGKR